MFCFKPCFRDNEEGLQTLEPQIFSKNGNPLKMIFDEQVEKSIVTILEIDQR